MEQPACRARDQCFRWVVSDPASGGEEEVHPDGRGPHRGKKRRLNQIPRMGVRNDAL